MSREKWVETARAFLPGVPAADRLTSNGSQSTSEKEISASLATALAAAGYRLKNGQSVSLLVPITKPQDLGQIIAYLHACRMDALAGLVRASWLSRNNMACSPDLLVWTRALNQKKYLKNIPSLQVRHIGLNRDLKKLEKESFDSDRILRTIVCQQNGTMRVFCEELQRHISTFAIVIDTTQFGYRDNPKALIGIMKEIFPDTPILLIANIADAVMANICEEFNRNLGMPVWRIGLTDRSIWSKPITTNWKSIIALLPDNRLNDRLKDAAYKCKELYRLLPKHYYEAASYPLYRVYNGLISLSVPIDFYETQGDIYRNGFIGVLHAPTHPTKN